MWPKLLLALLSSRAQKCYSHFKLDEVTDYDKVKEAILASYRLNARTYLSKLKSARRIGGDTYMIFLNKLEELFKFHLETQKIDIFDALVDEVVKLQFLESLDPTLRSFVEIRTPAINKMAAKTTNLTFETKSVDFSKKGKFDNKLKTNINFNSNRPMENGAPGSDGKAAQNDSQVLKCYLFDGNQKDKQKDKMSTK